MNLKYHNHVLVVFFVQTMSSVPNTSGLESQNSNSFGQKNTWLKNQLFLPCMSASIVLLDGIKQLILICVGTPFCHQQQQQLVVLLLMIVEIHLHLFQRIRNQTIFIVC